MGDIGNPESAATRFESYLTPILTAAYGTALHLTRHGDDAQDLVQEAALQAFRAFDSFQEGTNFKAWFFRILTNLFINTYRRRQRAPEVDTLSDLEDAPALYLFRRTREAGMHTWSSDPAALVLEKLDAEQICRAIAALPEDYRVVSALYFMEEFSYQEIAEMVGCPVGTVRSRLHRGRRMLQKALWSIAEQQGIVAALRVGGQ
jgi:RNA polymerase sigma-70 factor (ECF subfamily)